MREMVLPETWAKLFDGDGLEEKLAVSALLATVDEEGWPHVSFLSAGEVLAIDKQQMILMLWAQSTAATNLQRTHKAAFFAVGDGMVMEARLAIGNGRADGEGRMTFRARLTALRPHRAPYAEVKGLISFQLLDPADTLKRWRRQIAAMRTEDVQAG